MKALIQFTVQLGVGVGASLALLACGASGSVAATFGLIAVGLGAQAFNKFYSWWACCVGVAAFAFLSLCVALNADALVTTVSLALTLNAYVFLLTTVIRLENCK